MKTIHTIAKMQQFSKTCKNQHKTIAFVPTMGGVHKGHFALIEEAKKVADVVVVSIFVNPAQFGKNEDLLTYPSALVQDKLLLANYAIDVIFTPSNKGMYPLQDGFQVQAPSIANTLCGASRPVFFHGISLVVLKLLLIVCPNYVIFGQKDFQQLHIIKQLVQDFYLPIKVICIQTVREKDGLALSTRNQYLDKKQRLIAPNFYKTLLWVKEEILKKDNSIAVIKKTAIAKLEKYFVLDYLEIVDAKTLLPIQKPMQNMWLISALYLGKIRLIDNIEIIYV